VIHFISTAADLKKEPDIHEELRRRLEDRLKRLEGFAKLAESFANHLRTRLEALPQPKEDGDGPADGMVMSAKPPFG
jgi:hypothetical protein